MIQSGNTSTSCTVFANNGSPEIDAPGGFAAPSAGVITSWQITTGTAGAISSMTFALRTVSGGGGSFVIGQRGAPHAIPNAGGDLSFPERMSIGAGGKLGVDVQVNGQPGAGPYFYHSAGTLDYYTAPYALSPAADVNTDFSPGGGLPYYYRISLRATLEPDVDLDGYGDETQDKCVQRADAHESCPPPAISGLKYEKKAIKFTADRAGTRTLTIERSAPGRKSKGKCSTKAKSGKKCTAWKRVLKKTAASTAGANSIAYTGKAGSYRATLTVVNAEGLASTQTLKFKIKASKKKRR